MEWDNLALPSQQHQFPMAMSPWTWCSHLSVGQIAIWNLSWDNSMGPLQHFPSLEAAIGHSVVTDYISGSDLPWAHLLVGSEHVCSTWLSTVSKLLPAWERCIQPATTGQAFCPCHVQPFLFPCRPSWEGGIHSNLSIADLSFTMLPWRLPGRERASRDSDSCLTTISDLNCPASSFLWWFVLCPDGWAKVAIMTWVWQDGGAKRLLSICHRP